jgi:hypothetical protein
MCRRKKHSHLYLFQVTIRKLALPQFLAAILEIGLKRNYETGGR